MNDTHFIKKIAEILKNHYVETNAGVAYYNNALSDLMRDRDHSEEWKGKERERLVRERIAYTDSRKNDLRKRNQGHSGRRTAGSQKQCHLPCSEQRSTHNPVHVERNPEPFSVGI